MLLFEDTKTVSATNSLDLNKRQLICLDSLKAIKKLRLLENWMKLYQVLSLKSRLERLLKDSKERQQRKLYFRCSV